MKRASVVTRGIDVARLIDRVSSGQHGAISIFVGSVREMNEGRSVTGIEYSAYGAMAHEEMERILAEAESAFGVSAVLVEHRIGLLEVGDTSIAIVCAHAHRTAAMDSTRFIIEEIKKRVPIWKMEHYNDGTREWVDPTRATGEISRA
jgi:molybdopterin synthase catalytic subunit